jgi:FKBP-type peptidyl-prolyl cis-trans isomerase SlyD
MIKSGSVVNMTYVLTNDDGEEIDRADKSEPFTYLHGHNQIVMGLEKELLGLKAGDKKKVLVSPEEGYGDIDPSLITMAKTNQFPKGAELEVGVQFMAEDADGNNVVFTIVEIEGEDVTLDGNHPLAGETLNFDVEILGMREATPQELEHGHAHGDHGHDH